MIFTNHHTTLTEGGYMSKSDMCDIFDEVKDCMGSNAMIEHVYYYLSTKDLRELLADMCNDLSDSETQE